MRRTSFVLLAALFVALGACATGSGQTAPRTSRNVITEAEIQPEYGSNAFDLIRRLRPHFFQSRGETSLQSGAPIVQVYVDGMNVGGPDQLRTITIESIQEIRFMSAGDATTRFGTGHGAGAILVTTK